MNTPWIPAEQNSIVREQLADGETVSWVGQEPRSHYLSNRILSIVGLSLAVLFAGFFTVFMLFMNPNIFQGSIQSLLPVAIPLVFFCVAVYGLVRAVLSLVRGRPDLYVVTNQRAILIEQAAKTEVRSYGPEAVQGVRITRRKDGSGRIIFERIVSWGQDSKGRTQSRMTEIGFFGLPSVDEVCRHLGKISTPEASPTLGGEALPSPAWPEAGIRPEFFALEASALHECLYKVSIVSGQTCGAKIAGGFSSTGLKSMGENSGYGFLFSPWANRIAQREQSREARYQEINLLGPEFLAADKANFRYGRLDIEHVAIREEHKTLNNGYNTSGRLEIHLHGGKARKFWLTRSADPPAVAELFRTNGIRVEVRGGVPTK